MGAASSIENNAIEQFNSYSPTPTKNPIHYHENQIDDDEITVQTDNRSKTTQARENDNDIISTACMTDEDNSNSNSTQGENATTDNICGTKWGLSDTGATGTFVLPGALVINIRKATNPLCIKLPNGNYIDSMHECNLDIPWLPPALTEAHIVAGLAHSSLISIKQLCDHVAKVMYDDLACCVYYKEKLVWLGQWEPTTGLWVLPMQPNRPVDPAITPANCDTGTHTANSAYAMTSKESLLRFLHQWAFILTLPTWIKAINNGQFISWLGLTSTAVRKHLQPSPATDKGHIKQLCQNIRSTKKKK
ncbi:hypothetical protein ACHAXS_006328 [Conticribra weissflogii]